MYHAIVKRKVRRAFAALSRGDAADVIDGFSPDGWFVFAGNHALGVNLRGSEQVAQWFDRVFRVLPGLYFEPTEIVAAGGPWNTVVTTRFRVSAQLAGGRPYSNEGIQFLRLRWGKVVEDYIYEDTQKVAEALAQVAASGVAEAAAPPLGRTIS